MSAQVTRRSPERPLPHHKKMRCRQAFHFYNVEEKFAHGRGVGVTLFVIGQRLLPAAGNAAFADEKQGVASPIALHKAFQIAAVPGLGLRGQQLAYFSFVGWLCCAE